MYAGSIEVYFHTIKENKWLPLLRLSSERWKYVESKTADIGVSAVEDKIILKVNEDASGLAVLNTNL
jgi:hypothetical protein